MGLLRDEHFQNFVRHHTSRGIRGHLVFTNCMVICRYLSKTENIFILGQALPHDLMLIYKELPRIWPVEGIRFFVETAGRRKKQLFECME